MTNLEKAIKDVQKRIFENARLWGHDMGNSLRPDIGISTDWKLLIVSMCEVLVTNPHEEVE